VKKKREIEKGEEWGKFQGVLSVRKGGKGNTSGAEEESRTRNALRRKRRNTRFPKKCWSRKRRKGFKSRRP